MPEIRIDFGHLLFCVQFLAQGAYIGPVVDCVKVVVLPIKEILVHNQVFYEIIDQGAEFLHIKGLNVDVSPWWQKPVRQSVNFILQNIPVTTKLRIADEHPKNVGLNLFNNLC